MNARREENYQRRKAAMMENCFACYAEHGLNGVGIKGLAAACGCTSANLYTYFDNIDDLVVQTTAHCMGKVVDDFMALVPRDATDLERLGEVPRRAAEKHGQAFRLMYQVYTSPKYREHSKRFLEDVNRRCTACAAELAGRVGIPQDVLEGLLLAFVRACAHYALFEDERYLQVQLDALKALASPYLAQA